MDLDDGAVHLREIKYAFFDQIVQGICEQESRMFFFHISDLHIGKRVCGFSMLEDQREILAQILELAEEHHPDGILIAGDLYDKSMPSAEAVELADWFLSEFAARKIPVWVISGNHDCAERVAYGSQMMEQAGIYVSRVFDGTVQRYTVWKNSRNQVQVVGAGKKDTDDKAKIEAVDIYLLPYIKPAQVRRFFPEEIIETTQDAVSAILNSLELKQDRANILLMHQFMAGASICDSEEISVGGSDQVSAVLVDKFDYVALGHLHGPQKVCRETVRYCGSPLKYSFSEAGHRKSVTVVEIGRLMSGAAADEKAEIHVAVSTLSLIPRRDLREIRGPIDQLLSPDVYLNANTEDYLHITLTDENPILDAIGKLREVYPNIMRLDFEAGKEDDAAEEEIIIEEKSPQELFEEFFFLQNGREMNEEQRAVAEGIWNPDEKNLKGGERA